MIKFQITSILGGAFKENSAAGFAIFKFMQSLSCAIAFFYSPYLSLPWQLLITCLAQHSWHRLSAAVVIAPQLLLSFCSVIP